MLGTPELADGTSNCATQWTLNTIISEQHVGLMIFATKLKANSNLDNLQLTMAFKSSLHVIVQPIFFWFQILSSVTNFRLSQNSKWQFRLKLFYFPIKLAATVLCHAPSSNASIAPFFRGASLQSGWGGLLWCCTAPAVLCSCCTALVVPTQWLLMTFQWMRAVLFCL